MGRGAPERNPAFRATPASTLCPPLTTPEPRCRISRQPRRLKTPRRRSGVREIHPDGGERTPAPSPGPGPEWDDAAAQDLRAPRREPRWIEGWQVRGGLSETTRRLERRGRTSARYRGSVRIGSSAVCTREGSSPTLAPRARCRDPEKPRPRPKAGVNEPQRLPQEEDHAPVSALGQLARMRRASVGCEAARGVRDRNAGRTRNRETPPSRIRTRARSNGRGRQRAGESVCAPRRSGRRARAQSDSWTPDFFILARQVVGVSDPVRMNIEGADRDSRLLNRGDGSACRP